ncbi:hypothetical protein Ct61P_14531 [Colletotrichum tofieldiae]|nr:hypothetical protein Ct61P_14531 [Colletotrichum tofieldiae]
MSRENFTSQDAFFEHVLQTDGADDLPACYRSDFQLFCTEYARQNPDVSIATSPSPSILPVIPAARRHQQRHRTQSGNSLPGNLNNISVLPALERDVDARLLGAKASELWRPYTDYLQNEQRRQHRDPEPPATPTRRAGSSSNKLQQPLFALSAAGSPAAPEPPRLTVPGAFLSPGYAPEHGASSNNYSVTPVNGAFGDGLDALPPSSPAASHAAAAAAVAAQAILSRRPRHSPSPICNFPNAHHPRPSVGGQQLHRNGVREHWRSCSSTCLSCISSTTADRMER